MTFWQQQRIPVSRGWGPCKRTKWVPVSEHYSHQGADGYTRVRDWRVNLDPGVLYPTGGYYGAGNTGYLGFVERGPRRPVVDRDRGDRWNNRGVDELLRDVFAQGRQNEEDRQAGAERRTDAHRAVIGDFDGRIRDIEGRIDKHVEDYLRNLNAPISDERLTLLRAEAEVYADRGRQRADEQQRRDLERWREMHNAAIGRDFRRDMETSGFVPVTPVWGRRR
ncbi:hypothetical protein H2200_004543 [Cladophialophora chaetospira]|uniref:Uncharacterized protein n=1 Tax=Cladophialophora chaetospira TaxID=386627 RepID=A0AA39CKJ6_9EURO|nr:hypothetical protein H2200_004543 [Cladophialophora chaetospira]